ncbi:cell wall protein IFF6 isoform X2 [Rhopalosiphum maidis]|uniref:cell wall protein IFF6 isoform X2 n=1 Tax=Rhopalosiphum maidis TaxID=43146 RepID=UPI000EFF2068|nr:cell wall protein IFF6 isoform X2 [Rhopalosiphum maidis]
MGCVQSLFNSSKSRSPSPEKGFELPTFETMPVTRQPKKSYNTGISVADDRVHSDVEDDVDDADDDDDDDIAFRCDDFDRYAMEVDGDLHSLHFVEATACTTLAANSGTVAILGTTAKCKSADASPANRQRPPLVGSMSQPMMLESRFVKATAVRKLAADTGTIAVLSSTTEPEPQYVWVPEEEAHFSGRMAACRAGPSGVQSLDAGPSSSAQWPLQWPVAGDSKKSENLDRIPVGVIEVLDCEPADQCHPTPPKARRFPRAQRATRDQHIPLPVIHAMEIKPNALGHDDRFKTVTVQPPSSDRHGYRPRMTAGSATFDSSSRKPFVRQSNESREHKFTEDDYAAVTDWMANMPVFAKCPPAKSKSLPSRDPIPSNTSRSEGTDDRQHGVLRGSSLPNDNSSAEYSSKPDKRNDGKRAVMIPVAIESTMVVPEVKHKSDPFRKSDTNDKPDETPQIDVVIKSEKNDESDTSEKQNVNNTPDQNKESENDVQSDVKAKKDLENIPEIDQKNEHRVEEVNDGGADEINANDSKDQVPELDTEYRLTMIHSVREAVNKICEQAVERTAAIVKNRGINKRNSNSSLIGSFKDRDADNSETADNASSEFSLPPPPPLQQNLLDSGSTGQEWPPPPTLSEAEEERTIAPGGYSFDLPDPPTEMDQMDSETDKLDISDEEMRATGLPSDDEDNTSEADNGKADNDTNETDIVDAVMKSTANGGSSDGSVDSSAINVEAVAGANERAATTIQAVYRGFRARKYVEAVNAAAVKIQAGFRGYRVRQSLKNAAPSAAIATTDDSQCWSDDDQKSVVSVIYAPLKEYGSEPRGAADGRGDGDDGSDDDGDGPTSGVGSGENSVGGVVVDGGDGDGGDGAVDGVGGGDDRSVVVGSIDGGRVVGAVGVYVDDDDDDDQLQTGDDEVFERDDKDNGGGGSSGGSGGGVDVGLPVRIPTTITLTAPTDQNEVSAPDDAAEAEALVQAAVKIQARVRGFATRKRLNEEKNDGAEKQN